MKIEYSEHIKNRVRFRKVDYDLPKMIFEQSEGQKENRINAGRLRKI